MARESSIEWCDATFNPWIGCTKVSPACDNCYAAVSTPARALGVEWGAGKSRRRTSVANWKLPLRWNQQDFRQCGDCGWRGSIDTLESDCCPTCGKHENLDAARRRVFCASLADVFDNEVDPQWRADLIHLIFKTRNLDWLLLTKRIGNAHAMLERAVADISRGDHSWEHQWSRGFRHVAIGATICNQTEADRDIAKLQKLPSAVRFLSVEPMLGEVDLTEWLYPFKPCNNCPCPNPGVDRAGYDECCKDPELESSRISWVICGGESGPNARPMSPDWVRSVRDQCAGAGVPFLFKQWGEWLPMLGQIEGVKVGAKCTTSDGWAMGRAGKRAAGRLLDGRRHDGYPVTCTQ
jgi:protein gp37